MAQIQSLFQIKAVNSMSFLAGPAEDDAGLLEGDEVDDEREEVEDDQNGHDFLEVFPQPLQSCFLGALTVFPRHTLEAFELGSLLVFGQCRKTAVHRKFTWG